DLPRCMDLITAEDVIHRIEGYFQGGVAKFLTPEQAKAAAKAVREPVLQSSANARPGQAPRLPRIGAEPNPANDKAPGNGNGYTRGAAGAGLTLVTLNDEAMASVAQITAARLRYYADRHGYALVRYERTFDASRVTAWSKVLAVRHALLARQSEWVMW